jgi:hypothetical protein
MGVSASQCDNAYISSVEKCKNPEEMVTRDISEMPDATKAGYLKGVFAVCLAKNISNATNTDVDKVLSCTRVK